MLIISTPIFWRLLNILLLLWWLSIPISMFLISQAQKRQAERMAQEQEERERRAQSPFADMFRQYARGGTSAASAGPAKSGGSGGSRRSEGPIIEAEWTSIDDSDGSSSSRRR